MAQEPTERACDLCRERRVKCDKRRPSCLRCEKLGRTCPGYDKKRRFVDENEKLNKKYRTSIGESSSASHALADPPLEQSQISNAPQHFIPLSHPEIDVDTAAYTGSTGPEGHLKVPSQPYAATNVDVLAPVVPLPLQATPTVLDESWLDGAFDPQWFDLDPAAFYGPGGNSCGFLPGVPTIVDELNHPDMLLSTEMSATPLSTGLGTFSDSIWAPESQLHTSAMISDEREHEMNFLVRYFTEYLGPWMDLFDNEKHFTHLVPLKALRDALLRNAIAAVAAKQLGRVGAQALLNHQQHQQPSVMESIGNVAGVDWFYKAANYYDKAIAFSRQYLHAVSGSLSNPPTPNTFSALPAAKADDLLVAVSIFSLYESLDNTDVGWLQHLNGFKSLLTATNTASLDESGGHKASFWTFVRADIQAAYVRHEKTLLDTDDIALWQNHGLQIQPDGNIYTSPSQIKNDTRYSRSNVELVAHTLLWLTLCVMNHIANESDATDSALRSEQWQLLSRRLDEWHANLPDTYQPCARVAHPQTRLPGSRIGGGTPHQIVESFFSIDVCAATTQLYHFARILLLLHRPPSIGNNASGSRLKAYREVSNAAIRHAREIIGIALGRPHIAIRVEMLLPLFIAGSTLEADHEREIVLTLLRAIEKDTGYPTESRCQQLIHEYWGWTSEPQEVA